MNIETLKQLIATLYALVALLKGQVAAQEAAAPIIVPAPDMATSTFPIIYSTSTGSIGEILSTSTLNFGGIAQNDAPASSPLTIAPRQIGWDEGSLAFGVNGIVDLDTWYVSTDTIHFEYHSFRGLFTAAQVTIGSTTYPMELTTIGAGTGSVATLAIPFEQLPNQTFQYETRIDAGSIFAIKDGTISLP